MDQPTHPRRAAEEYRSGGRATALRLPVRYLHDPSTDRWSYTIEIPPITGGGCGCREVAERSAVAALRRHLARRVWPRTDAEHIGHLSLALAPAVDERGPAEPPPPAHAPVASVAVGFHPFATSTPVCTATVDDVMAAPQAPPQTAAPAAARRVSFGFHPHALTTPVPAEVQQNSADRVTLVGRCAAWATTASDATARVVIIDAATDEQIDGCTGPRRDGSCSLVTAGSVVRCAGWRIRGELCGASRRYRFDVAPDSTRCPLAWLVARVVETAR